MSSKARGILLGRVSRWWDPCALALLLLVPTPAHAQPSEDGAQVEPAARPDSALVIPEAPAHSSDPGAQLPPLPAVSPAVPVLTAPPPVAAPSAGEAARTAAPVLGPAPPASTLATARPFAAKKEPLVGVSLGAALALSHVSESGSSTSLAAALLQGSFALRPNAGIEVEWPLALLLDSEGLASVTARSGNPHVGVWYRRAKSPTRWRVGIAATAPLATVNLGDDGRLQRQLYNQGAAAWGMWDAWRWGAGRVAIPLAGSLSYDLDDHVALLADVSAGPSFGVRTGENGTDLLAQIAAGIRVEVADSFALTPSVQTVLLPSASVDRLQTSGLLRADWPSHIGRLYLKILINLDEPLGVFGRGTQAWGLHVGKELDP